MRERQVRTITLVAMRVDHYEVLGVGTTAGHQEIRAAYRRLIREHHPDLRPGDPAAEEAARRITAAWTVLGRPASRTAYDRQRSAIRQTPPAAMAPVDTARAEAVWAEAARADAAARAAYSPAGAAYRRAFHLASVKIATAVFIIGLLLLVALSA